MFSFLRNQHDIILPSLPQEVWMLIFSNLEPCFLNDILNTSKFFNLMAKSNLTIGPKLLRYFPEMTDAQITKSFSTENACITLFSNNYTRKLSCIKSSLSRQLFTFILEEDIDQIKKLKISGKQFFNMLCEKDIDGNDMLFHLNKINNQNLNNFIIAQYLTSKSLSFILFLPNNPRLINYLSYLPKAILENILDFFELAAALNINNCVEYFDLIPHFSDKDARVIAASTILEKSLLQATRFGHNNIVKHILTRVDEITLSISVNDNLLETEDLFYNAIKYNHIEVVKSFLGLYPLHISLTDIINALEHSVKFDRRNIAELLLTTIPDDYNSTYLQYSALLGVQFGSLSSLESVLKRFPELKRYLLEETRTYKSISHVAVAIIKGDLATVDFLCRQFKSTESPFFEYAFETMLKLAVISNNVKIVEALLKHGALVSESVMAEAYALNNPTMITVLKDYDVAIHNNTIKNKM